MAFDAAPTRERTDVNRHSGIYMHICLFVELYIRATNSHADVRIWRINGTDMPIDIDWHDTIKMQHSLQQNKHLLILIKLYNTFRTARFSGMCDLRENVQSLWGHRCGQWLRLHEKIDKSLEYGLNSGFYLSLFLSLCVPDRSMYSKHFASIDLYRMTPWHTKIHQIEIDFVKELPVRLSTTWAQPVKWNSKPQTGSLCRDREREKKVYR